MSKKYRTTEEIIADKKRETELKRMREQLAKQQEEFIELLRESNPELFDENGEMLKLDEIVIEDFDNCKVKFRQDFMENWIKINNLTQKYKDWYAENKDKEFIAHKMSDSPLSQYKLEGVDLWSFNYFDFEKVEG